MATPTPLEGTQLSYALPEGQIAQRPLEPRDASRLLCYREGEISESRFAELPSLLPEQSLLVMNTTRVVPARLEFATATGAHIELFCLHAAHDGPAEQALAQTESVEWVCMVGNLKRWHREPLSLNQPTLGPLGPSSLQLTADYLGPHSEGHRIAFRWQPAQWSFAQVLEAAGQVPLPPYLKRDAEAADTERYQTIYADRDGAVAAPTAGLHFTPAVLDALRRRGVQTEQVLLHVGAGTFKPMTAATVGEHVMHQEQIMVSRTALAHLAEHLARASAPLVAVGTTSMRTLESLYWLGLRQLRGNQLGNPEAVVIGQWEPYQEMSTTLPAPADALGALVQWLDAERAEHLRGSTQLMIVPGYPFQVCEGLITNFHQPESTLLLLVAAFIGDDWQRVYDYALAHEFRFLSYGDASLLWRKRAG